jgi:outer membrane cobalamin receptor
MKTLFILFLLTCGFSYVNIAQATEKGIYLVDARTKLPLQDVSLVNEAVQLYLISDQDGFADLAEIPDSVQNLFITRIGYQSFSLDLRTLSFQNNRAVVALTGGIPSLEEIKIISSQGRGVFKTIGDLDIHLRPINNSQEVLRMVPGLFIGQHAGGGKAEQIFLRGFDLDHGTDINISVDGMPVNMVSHAHGQGYADLHFVIPELIDKVDFGKGPYEADKGNYTTAGYVAFKTRDYLENNFAKIEAGQFNSLRAIAGVNLLRSTGNRRNQGLYFAGEGSFTQGYFDSPQDFSRYNGILKYHGSLNTRNTLTAMLTAFTSKWNASGQIPERAIKVGLVGFYGAIDDTEGGHTSRHNASVKIATRLNNTGRFTNQLFYSRYQFELYSNFTFFRDNPFTGDQIRQKESRNIFGYHGSYEKELQIGNVKSAIKTGLQVRYDDVDNIELTRTKDRRINVEGVMKGDIDEVNIGAYYSQRFAFTKKLDITAVLRTDHFRNRYQDGLVQTASTSASNLVSPKLNIDYRLNEKVWLYLYNGKGFHSNDTRVIVLQQGKKVSPPAYGSDLGAVLKINKKLLLKAALWYLWLDQEFVYVGDEGVVEPGGKTRRVGFDLSARYEVREGLFADLDLSLADPRATGVGRSAAYLPLAPLFTSVGGLTYRRTKGFNGSLRYRFMGNRPANETNTVVAKGYFIADAALNYAAPKWEAGISIQNLFNSKWKETQFETESRLKHETVPVSEIHFTAGTPFFARLNFTVQL